MPPLHARPHMRESNTTHTNSTADCHCVDSVPLSLLSESMSISISSTIDLNIRTTNARSFGLFVVNVRARLANATTSWLEAPSVLSSSPIKMSSVDGSFTVTEGYARGHLHAIVLRRVSVLTASPGVVPDFAAATSTHISPPTCAPSGGCVGVDSVSVSATGSTCIAIPDSIISGGFVPSVEVVGTCTELPSSHGDDGRLVFVCCRRVFGKNAG